MICLLEGCEYQAHCRGMCKSHYERARTGKPLTVPLWPKTLVVRDGIKQCCRCRRYLPVAEFHQSSKTKTGYSGRCRECHRTAMRQSHFTLSDDAYEQMLVAQGGLCAGCHHVETALSRSGSPKPLGVDHDHVSGRVRGLLCSRCNSALGLCWDDPAVLRRLAAYLEQS